MVIYQYYLTAQNLKPQQIIRDPHNVSLHGIQKDKWLFSLYSGNEGQARDPCSDNYMFFPGMLNRNKK